MAIISVFSAKGAPGATTTAMLLAGLWPRDSILLDADLSGGDVALRLPARSGHALDPNAGLMSLLPAARRGMTPELVREHTQVAMGGQPVLCGLAGPEQALAIGGLWPTLADAFAEVTAADVIADLGQVHSRAEHLCLLDSSVAAVLVYSPTAWGAVHTRRRLESLADGLTRRGVVVGIVGIASSGQERDVAAAAANIADGLDWVRDWGTVAWDPKASVMFSGGSVFRPERTMLVRSGNALAARIYAAVDRGAR
ncbi:MAG: hypothetical protein ACRCYQ_15200 [Nocardioides sp.]